MPRLHDPIISPTGAKIHSSRTLYTVDVPLKFVKLDLNAIVSPM